MSEQENIKNIITQEYIKCASDPIHFFRKYCYIQHPIKGRILFHLYPFQEDVLNDFRNQRFNIINKSRQLGISTLAAGFSLHTMLFNKDKTVLCIATKQETAKGMVDKVQFMYNNLPGWLRGNKKPISDNKLSLKLANNSQIIATSAASDAGRSYAVSLLLIDEAAFIEGIDKIYTSIKPTIATGGRIIALSSPNGIGNWFHRMYTEAQMGDNDFNPRELKWDLHPDRDQMWYDTEKSNMSAREFAQEYSKQYMVTADVARGDGNDYSAFHVIDVESCEQVGEFKSHIGTREYGHMLASVAAEYNNAMLIVENANIGWDVVNTIIEKGYQNLYYSPRSYGDMSMDKYLDRLENDQVVPGFTNSVKTRPLVISKMESYIREGAFIFHSKRLLEELRVFIWHNGKAQAQNGYTDDLVLSCGFGLFLRDTALKYQSAGLDITRASLAGMSKTGYDSIYPTMPGGFINPYEIDNGMGGKEDITWLF